MPPVVDRELSVASRRPWTYWGRTVAGAVAIASMAWVLAVQHQTTGSSLGASLFAGAAFFAWAYAWLAGAGSSADALSSERREGTLGLLFLTDLRAFDILLGKLVATSLGAVYCAVAMLPIIAIAILLGGVSLGQYLRMALAVVVTLGCSLGVGLWASTFGERSIRSSGLTLLGMTLLSALIPLLGVIFRYVAVETLGVSDGAMDEWYRTWFSWASPAVSYSASFDGGYGLWGSTYWKAIGFTAASGMLAVVWALRRLKHIAFDEGRAERRSGWVALAESWRWPTRSARDAWRRRLLDQGVMVWLSGRLWTQTGVVWGLLVLGVGMWWLIRTLTGVDRSDGRFIWVVISFVLHALFKLSVASEAPRQFHEDRRSGAMELMLTTPLEPGAIVRGRMRALLRRYLGPLLMILMLDAVCLMQWERVSDSKEGLWLVGARLVTLVIDCGALAWTGMWVGVSSRGKWTTMPTWFRVMAGPYLLGMLLVPGGWLRDNEAILSFFYGFGILWSLLWMFFSRERLLREFRDRATGSG